MERKIETKLGTFYLEQNENGIVCISDSDDRFLCNDYYGEDDGNCLEETERRLQNQNTIEEFADSFLDGGCCYATNLKELMDIVNEKTKENNIKYNENVDLFQSVKIFKCDDSLQRIGSWYLYLNI